MSNPDLRRPVWLTTEQRLNLRDAAVRAMEKHQDEHAYCESVLRELSRATHRGAGSSRLIRRMVETLRMPEDIVPVYLSDAEVNHVIEFGNVKRPLARLLQNKPPRPRKQDTGE